MSDLTIESVLEGLGLNCARSFTGLMPQPIVPLRRVPISREELAAKVAELEPQE